MNTMWKEIIINKTQIERETDRGILVKVPGSNWKFWYTKKLIKTYGKRYRLLYTNDFKFNLFKNGKGKTNKFEIVNEKIVSAAEIEDMFEGNLSIERITIETREAEKLENIKTEVVDELLDN